MPAGRPREHNREQIVNDLIEWAKKDDSININKFCAYKNLAPSKLSEWSRESEEFRLSYETAKTWIAFRREELLTQNALHVKAYDMNASVYDYFIRAEKRDLLAYESSLKQQENKIVSVDIEKSQKQLMDMLDQRRSQASNVLNIDDNKINAAARS